MSDLLKIPYSAGGLHLTVVNALKSRWVASEKHMEKKIVRFDELEKLVRAYIPEAAATARAKSKYKKDGEATYYPIQIPHAYAELQTVHTYMAMSLLGRYPILQYSGRHGEAQNNELAVESIMDYQMRAGDNIIPLYIWLYDANKYGLGIVSNFWQEDWRTISRIETRTSELTGIEQKVKTKEKVLKYAGNKFHNIRPHDFLPDPRVPMGQVQKGEYCGWKAEISWSDLMRGEEMGLYNNIKELKKRTMQKKPEKYDTFLKTPDINTDNVPFELEEIGFVPIKVMVVSLSPKAWGLGKSSAPEKWVFVIADSEVIIQARPQGEYHDDFPVVTIEPEYEGYHEFSFSRLETVEPMNDVISWLYNTHFMNVRKSLNDMFVVDPTKIEINDLLDPEPGKLIRTKPMSFGNIRDSIAQFPVNDVTQMHMQDARAMTDVAHRVMGTSDAMMGAAPSSSRRTATEIQSTNQMGTARLRSQTEFVALQGISKLSMMALTSSQQHYDFEMEFKIARELANEQRSINVTPDMLAGSYDYIPVIGGMPYDNQSQQTLWKDILLQGGRIEGFNQQFDLTAILGHIAQLSGIRNIDSFKLQAQSQDPRVLEQQAQAGNIVPIGAGGIQNV